MILSFDVKNNKYRKFIFYGIKNNIRIRIDEISSNEDCKKNIETAAFSEIKVMVVPASNTFFTFLLFLLFYGISVLITSFGGVDFTSWFYRTITIPVEEKDVFIRYNVKSDLITSEDVSLSIKDQGQWLNVLGIISSLLVLGMLVGMCVYFNIML